MSTRPTIRVNADTDRDGDGFSNEVELSRKSNPDDAADYPDDVAPALTVDNPSGQSLEQTMVLLTGAVTDPEQPYSGITRVSVESSAFADATFSATVTANRFARRCRSSR
ncbi:hypothetical protein [Allohahella sp. A8]|uniref:hypothetical protein n=1 Tax=Allohahella sp. A8 TaxID=3141461 RepID=UPI003A806567